VALSTDSTTCFFSGNRQGIYTYYQRELKSILFPLQGGISGLSLFPTGEYLAVAGEINWLQPEPTSFTPPSPLQLDQTAGAQSYAVAFHPENDLLALATDQSIEFWTLGNSSFVWGLPIHSLFNETVSPVELTFSPDGSLLVLATSNGLLHVFGIPLIPAN
jgi:WD40 repeat protein